MIKFYKIIESLFINLLIISDRVRAVWLRFRGARIDSQTRIGKGLKISRPWVVSIGKRVEIQEDVSLQNASDYSRINIGDFAFIGKRVVINITGDLTIGSHSLIGRVFI